MPHEASSTKRAGSLHVQPLTSRPASWQSAIWAAVIVGSHGCTATWPRRTSISIVPGSIDAVSHAVGTARVDEAAAVDGLQPERREQPSPVATLGQVGEHLDGDAIVRVEVRLRRIVLDLDVHPRALAGVERGTERRHVLGDLAPRCGDDHPAVGQRGVVVHDEHAVGRPAHVQLDAVGADLDGTTECPDRVLPRQTRGPSMGNDLDHRLPGPLVIPGIVP